jgi:UDP-N-acetylglucosamine--N-acetylmuramyl-(pentapeptide) pyrophosphoryl-undecaprenol N-acetylglucosamine transferase
MTPEKAKMKRSGNEGKSIRVILTGGGTAGHVMPNVALIPQLQSAGCSLFYIASRAGIENELLKSSGVPVFRICSGKLRRYFCIETLFDVRVNYDSFLSACR